MINDAEANIFQPSRHTVGEFDGKKSWPQIEFERAALAVGRMMQQEKADRAGKAALPKSSPRRQAKIVRVELVYARRAKWPVIKVREVSERGRAMNVVEFDRYDQAVAHARKTARTHNAELVLPK